MFDFIYLVNVTTHNNITCNSPWIECSPLKTFFLNIAYIIHQISDYIENYRNNQVTDHNIHLRFNYPQSVKLFLVLLFCTNRWISIFYSYTKTGRTHNFTDI